MADSRMLDEARTEAVFWLSEYAAALRDWNAPDDAHTRLTLRGMVEDTIKEVVPE